MGIEYHYPVEHLDQIIEKIDSGITPMMSPELKAEVQLRYHELQHQGDDDYEDDEDFRSAVEKHESVMQTLQEQKRKSHSRDVIVLDLTEDELNELHDGMSESYVRSNPQSPYNLSDDDISSDAERRRIFKQLQTVGKIYYHQEDYRNAINIIKEAIEYSLKNDYPWLSYEEACEEFRKGKIKYTFAQMPLLYIDYDTQITDPSILSGIVSGDINLIDKDQTPVKRKKRKSNPVSMPYTVIGPQEHAEMVKMHQAGWNTPISAILKSCSTIYNRYVMPSSFQMNSDQDKPLPVVDWRKPGAGKQYFEEKYGVVRNPITEVTQLLNEQNDGTLRHTIGTSMREFLSAFNQTPEQQTFKSISTSLVHDEQATQIESRILDLIRQSNPNI